MSETWKELCRDLAQSDEGAFERVFRRTREDLVRYVASIVRDDAAAHDLVQDVFAGLWDLRATLDPERSLLAYIFRMARNRAYRHLRDTRIHARHDAVLAGETPDAAWPEDGVDAEMLDMKLFRWMEELPNRQREALRLSRLHGLSHQEIAAVMEVSPRTVNNHIMRALETLRDRLEKYETQTSRETR